MRPTDLGLFRLPGVPTLSPDGAVAVVAVSRPDPGTDAYVSQLWWIVTDGSEPPRPLTYGRKDSAPAFSPDGRWLAFLRAVDDKPQVHVLAVHGGEPRCLTEHPLGASGPVWAPDSTRIAYVARVPEPGRYGTVEGVGPDKEPPRLITELAYRVDDVGFTGDRRKHVFVLDVGAEEPRPTQLTRLGTDHTEPAWSPDGTLVAYVAAMHDGRERDLASDVVVIPAAGGEPRRLTAARQAVSTVAFAADGASVWFLAGGDLGVDGLDFVANQEGLWSVPLDGSGPATRHTDPETDDLSETVGGLTITDAGVLAGRLHRGAVELARLPAGGGRLEPLLTGDRQVHGHAVAGDVLVATVADPTTLGEVVTLRDGAETVLTTFGAELAGQGIRPVEEVTASAPDGYPVHGWVVRPVGDGPHPVILSIHGGPFAQYGWGLFDEAQMYAAAGYVVLLCNPRGAAGYGAAHGRAIRQDMGNLDATDVLAFLDAALQAPDLDGDRVGVMGGSYGGYMTTWLIGHTDRFTAAISERAFNEPVSFVGSSDIGWFFPGEYVGTDPARVAAQSPFTTLDKITTPTLVIHSEHDWRCPVEQGQRLFVALKMRGVPTELLLFPGEGHELSRSGLPSHRIARFEHILRWWGTHLPVAARPE